MCFMPKIDMPKVTAGPTRDPLSSIAQNARATALRAKGESAAIATTPLGDSGFGRNLRRATLLGTTA